MQKHRRQVLGKVATLYKNEKEVFFQKYRIFQLHKWEILKQVKQRMLEQKIKEVTFRQRLRQWMILMTQRDMIKRFFEVFDRQRFFEKRRVKMMFIMMRIKMKIRKSIFNFGKHYEDREKVYVKDSAIAIFGGLIRPTIRERAKRTLINHLSQERTTAILRAKFTLYTQKITLI